MSGSRLRDVMARILAIVLFCLSVGPARAQDASWLYVVEVPVADQSAEARQQGARDALVVALTRLTGLATLRDDPRVRRAIGNPDSYYAQFGYTPGTPPAALNLRVQFSPQALFDLIHQTGLPVWPSARPSVRAWLVIDEGSGVRLAQAAEDPLVKALLARSRERGLLVDIGAIGAVGPLAPGGPAAAEGVPVQPIQGLWNMPSAELLTASEQAPVDLQFVARVHGAEGDWSAGWEIAEERAPPARQPGEVTPAPGGTVEPTKFEARGASAEALAGALIDQLVEYLLPRSQVQAGDSRVLRVGVRGLGSARDYAAALRLFSAVEVIDDVAVAEAAGDRIVFTLTTMAAMEQVLTLVTADGYLAVDAGRAASGGPVAAASTGQPFSPGIGNAGGGSTAAPAAGATLELIWRGG